MADGLPPPEFFARDPQAIAADLVAEVEARTGQTLRPGQYDRLLVDVVAYLESLFRIAANEAARQNLLAYARYPMLDHLAALWGVVRLEGEGDAALRARIRAAPDGWSVAGPRAAYRWHALSADPAVVDVAVASPEPGLVRVTVLAADGLPSAETLAAVDAALSDDAVRPLCDTVAVAAPERVTYGIEATLTLTADADEATTLAAAQAAAQSYAADRRAKLGQAIVPSQIVAALSLPGVWRVQLAAPAYRDLAADEWADCAAIDLTLEGADGTAGGADG